MACAERLQDMDSVRKRAAAHAVDEQQRQAAYYNARRREISYEVGDLLMKRNRVLSSAAQGISAKLAPQCAGPLKITEITSSNTVRVVHEKDASEEILHVSNLKPYNDEDSDETGEDPPNSLPLLDRIPCLSWTPPPCPPKIGGRPSPKPRRQRPARRIISPRR